MKSQYEILVGSEVYTFSDKKIFKGVITKAGKMPLYKGANKKVNYVRVEWDEKRNMNAPGLDQGEKDIEDYRISEIGSKIFLKIQDAERALQKTLKTL